MATEFGKGQRRGLTAGAPESSPAPLHYVVAKDSDGGLEVLRVPLGTNGEVLPVFSAGWAASGYLFAEAPGRGWYVKTCTPDELVSLLVGPCAGVEWVALDTRPGRSEGEAANVMPWENFMDYLLARGRDRANGDTHEEVTSMWSKLFGGGDGLPREKVDAVVRVIDRYLADEAELCRLQSERQTIHPKDLPSDKRRALIEEVFAILADTKRKWSLPRS